MAEMNRKTELNELLLKKVTEYNEAVLDGDYNKAFKINEETAEAVNEYTSIVRKECFDACLATDDPMREAVTRLTFETLAIKDTKQGDEKIPVRELVTKDKAIDLLKLHKAANGGIGADKSWNHIAEKMNFLLTAQTAIDIGVKDIKTISNSFAMSEIARQIDMGKSPTSKNNLLKTLQAVITAMLGEGAKATSHDVNFLLKVYTKKKTGRALTVACANHSHFRGYLAEICHRIVTGGKYDVEYKKAK